MITRGRELAAGLANVQLIEGDAGTLPFEDGAAAQSPFTAVLCTTAFHHFPEPERAVAEMARVLAPGGRVAIGDATADLLLVRLFDHVLRRTQAGHVGLRTRAQLRALLAGAGFAPVGVRTLMNGVYAIVLATLPAE